MKKKVFVLTGEASGDKLASKAISKLKELNNNIEYLSVGGENLKSIGINSIFDLSSITYLGFTKVIFNLFKIKKKINYTVKRILDFNPDILFSVDSPDFTLRVAKIIKKKNSNIKTIHYIAPKVWVWREGRVKKIKKFIDHLLLLFKFEKKYFDKENVISTFVGHPLLEAETKNKIEITHLIKKKIVSLFPGSRLSEINVLMPILIDFITLSQVNNNIYTFVFHTTHKHKNLIHEMLLKSKLKNCELVSNESIKKNVLSNSIFAISKSGTISLEICNVGVPTIIIYKMNLINFLIIKSLTKIKYANIINIISNSEVIPELLQSRCNSKNIYELFCSFMSDSKLGEKQVSKYKEVLKEIKLDVSPSVKIASILNDTLIF